VVLTEDYISPERTKPPRGDTMDARTRNEIIATLTKMGRKDLAQNVKAAEDDVSSSISGMITTLQQAKNSNLKGNDQATYHFLGITLQNFITVLSLMGGAESKAAPYLRKAHELLGH
jgi:hypothetical protein